MIRIIYSGSVTAPVSPERLAQFLADSRKRNLRDGICGVMIMIGQDFLQIIEGPEQDVDRYYRTAFSDNKRYSLLLLSRQTIDEPIFGAWSLGFIKAEPNMSLDQICDQTLLDIVQINPSDPHALRTLRLIREFIDGQWHYHVHKVKDPIRILQTRHH